MAAAAAVLAAGCGDEGDAGRRDAPTQLPASMFSRPQITPRPIVLRDQLVAIRRQWPGIATSDRLAIDEHGGGRIVRGGGGGGLRVERCTFTPAEMSGWRRDLHRIGMSRPSATSPLEYPATYVIDYRGRQRIVQTGAMPRRYLALTRRFATLVLRGGKGCHTIYSQRRH